ncbi:hypothetical protein BH09MYX1_BH09MYX1_55270 [soil metagenome]
MKATVVIPTYNRASRLRELLSCLVHQDQETLAQVVVCDDGSPDDTRAVANAFEGKLPLVYRHQEDRGFRAGQARNMGISEARGDIIMFVDDDVLVAPDFVAAHIAAHRASKRTSVVLGYRHRSHEATVIPPTLEHIVASEADDRVVEIGPDGAGIAAHKMPWMFVYSCNFSVPRGTPELSFDERFLGWGLEDIDIGYRLWRAGNPVIVAPRACVLHIEDVAPRDPFRCEERKLPPTYDSYVRNAVHFMDKHEDAAVRAWVRNDLRWYVRDEERGAWVKNGYENDVEAVISACRAELRARAGALAPTQADARTEAL